jgi:hypothetical protein
MVAYQIVEAKAEDLVGMLEVMNDAFMVDAFFKKPEHRIRFTLERIAAILQGNNSLFLIAKNESNEILGSIQLEYEIEEVESDVVVRPFSNSFPC